MGGSNEYKKIEATKIKGDPMSAVLLFFVAGAICLFAAVWIYSRSEDTAYHKVLSQYNNLVGDYNTVKASNETLTKSNQEMAQKVVELTNKLDQQSLQLAEVVKDCEAAQTHCAKLRESMIDLQDKISKRRPVTRVEGPILVEIVKALPKDATLRNQKTTPAATPQPPPAPAPAVTPKKGLGRGIGSLLPKKETKKESSK